MQAQDIARWVARFESVILVVRGGMGHGQGGPARSVAVEPRKNLGDIVNDVPYLPQQRIVRAVVRSERMKLDRVRYEKISRRGWTGEKGGGRAKDKCRSKRRGKCIRDQVWG